MVADATQATPAAPGTNANVINGSRTWLTVREREILDLRCHGLTNAQIAAALGVSPKTVDAHLANAQAVNRAHTQFELLARYVRGELGEGAVESGTQKE